MYGLCSTSMFIYFIGYYCVHLQASTILAAATARSFVIFDELGRGTSTQVRRIDTAWLASTVTTIV